ncbi:MAG TPA: hypothetical protein ENJ56_08625 [Anaerolineae bacterium]|nr:hypothetical protein [Anaerolineae bacterium]
MQSQQITKTLTFSAAIALSAATGLGFFGSLCWVFGLLDHLRPYYVLGLVVVGIVLLWQRSRWGWLLILPLAINLFLLAPLFMPAQTQPAPAFTITHINLDKDKVAGLEYAARSGSDIVLLQELTPALAGMLTTTLPAYALVLAHPLWNTHGSALLVRREGAVRVAKAEIIHLPATAERPLISAEILVDQTHIQLLSLHTTRVRNAATAAGQAAEFTAVANWSSDLVKIGQPVLIIGDFNTTPWSRQMHRLLSNGQLQNGMNHHGWQPSFPTQLPVFLQIPIDLLVHSEQLRVTNLQTSPNLGSDHRGLSVGVGFH